MRLFSKNVQLDDNGRPFRVTRGQRKSEQRLIPLTPAPKTRAQKVARSLWG